MTVKRRIILFVAAVWLLFSQFSADSQNLPVLPQDPDIATGMLSDSISYYIVTNRTHKGVADFALVQKVGHADEDSLSRGKALSIAQSSLASLPKFAGRDPETFLVSYGMSGRKGMLVDVRDDATVYRFEKMPLSHGDAAIDSTLLMIFDIIEGTAHQDDIFFRSRYATSSQAIIVSGDIDRDVILNKLKLLSLMVPAREGDYRRPHYRWHRQDSIVCSVIKDEFKTTSSLTVSYRSPRVPKVYMNTVLPSVSERLGDIFGTVLRKRLYAEFKNAGIPVSAIRYQYRKSTDSGGDEKYSITVNTEDIHVDGALSVIAGVLASIDSSGLLPDEFAGARDEYLFSVYEDARRPLLNNRHSLNRCISSFLYGADLALPLEKYNFFVSGNLPDSVQVKLFNNFASKLLDGSKNLSISCTTSSDSISCARLKSAFRTAWDNECAGGLRREYPIVPADSIVREPRKRESVRLVSDRKEPVSGGRLWTFSNGINVVYKRLPTGGIFYYDLMVRGGYSTMKDIRKGEGAFLSSLLEACDIAGMSSDEFHYMMNAKGVSMSSDVGTTDLHIYGKAPRPSLDLLFASLKAVANSRSINTENYEYVRKCMDVALRARAGSIADRMVAIDSLLCPSNTYSSAMSIRNINPDLPVRAEAFFESQFSKINDGVLVLIGDIEETAMSKYLQKALYGFRTRRTTIANIRPSYQPIAGGATYIREGAGHSLDVVMSTLVPFTAENYMATRIAALAVRDAVAKALCGSTARFRLSYDTVVFPQERFNLAISVYDADPAGSPEGSHHLNSLEALYLIRSTLARLSSEPVSDSDLNVYKSVLVNEIASDQTDPGYLTYLISLRYSSGKDLKTKYEEKIASVTAGRVREIISSLDSGGKIEYVIIEK